MRSFCLILIFSLLYSCLFATNKISIQPAPSWLYSFQPDLSKQPEARTISNGYYIQLVNIQTNLLNETEYYHIIRKIVNESGVQNASEVSVSFAPEYQKLVFHKIWVIRDGKIINEINLNQIQVVQEETEAATFIYNGEKRAFVILKNIRKNDQIEFSYSLIGFNPVFSNIYSASIYFYGQAPITNYFQSIVTSLDRKLNFVPHEKAPMPQESVVGNSRVYHWDNPTIAIPESQSMTPTWFDNYPSMDITEFKSWEEVINWGIKNVNNYAYVLPAPLKAKIMEWRKIANGDQDVFATYARRFVQDDIRYLGLEIGEHTHLPHPPAEVFENGFGDCKDKALLLAVILQQENIPAYLALVNTQQREWITNAAPSGAVFNHAIVAVARSSGYIFIDATVSSQRGEMSNLYSPPYGYALVLKKGATGFQKMEADDFNSSIITENLFVSDSDSSRLEVSTQYCGGKADELRSSMAESSLADLEKSYERFYVDIFEGITTSIPISTVDDSSRNLFTVKEQYSIPSLWKTNSKGKEYFSTYAKTIHEFIPNPSALGKNIPLALTYPSTTKYTLTLNMPSDWSFPDEPVHIKNDYYQYDFTSNVIGKVIILKYSFQTFQDNVPAGAIAQYKEDYKKISASLEYELSRQLPGAVSTPTFKLIPTSKINWVAVWVSFIILAGLSFLFRYLNKQELQVDYDRNSGYKLGGWIILLGVSLGLSGLLNLMQLIKGGYYGSAGWEALGTYGTSLQVTAIVELGLILLLLSQCIALSYWYLKRRDIFRKYFLFYIGTLLVSNCILFIIYSNITYPASFGNFQKDAATQFGRGCFYAAIWGTYIVRSQRVKGTFLKGA